MQVQIGVTLDASPALLEVLNNLTAALTADNTIARAARTPRATKKDAPAADPAPAEVPGKSAPAAESSTADTEKSTVSGSAGSSKTEPPTEAPGKSAAAAASTPPSVPASTAASGSASAATTSPSSTPSAITREQIRVALGKLAQTDKARALAILSENGATSVTTLAVEKYPAVLAAATA